MTKGKILQFHFIHFCKQTKVEFIHLYLLALKVLTGKSHFFLLFLVLFGFKICFSFRERDSESPQDLSRDTLLDKESFNEEDSKSEASPPSTPQSASGSNRPPPPLIPFTTKTPGNPLQQMVSITNSLTALPPPPLASPTSALSFRSNGGANSASSAAAARVAGNKMALPPISQEQFDKYSHINTELLVRKVRIKGPQITQ